MNVLLEMSLSAGLFILVVAAIRRLLMHRLPKRMFMILLFVALFQLLVPMDVPSPMSIFNFTGDFNLPSTLDLLKPEYKMQKVLIYQRQQ